jgi:hypothetical protein
MENFEKLDLVALDAAELTQVQGGSPILAVVVAINLAGLGICAAIEYKSRKSKQVKLLENVSGVPK